MLVCEIYESSLSFLSHALKKIGEAGNEAIIGASLSEPHIDELNVRNLYIIIMVRTSPAHRCRDCTGVRDIFQHNLEAA